MVEQETVNKTLKFISEITHTEAIADDKKVVRDFLRGLTKFGELDSYALDYTDESFRFSLIKCPEERIFRFNIDGTIEDLGNYGANLVYARGQISGLC